MTRILKARREQLPEFAERVYQFMAAEVDIQGTDQSDRFDTGSWRRRCGGERGVTEGWRSLFPAPI